MSDYYLKFKVSLEFRGDDSVFDVIKQFLEYSSKFKPHFNDENMPPTFSKLKIESPIEVDEMYH